MKITFVLPTFSLTGGMRVLSIYTELLQKRGHKHYEAFGYVPKGRVESTWWLPMHKIAVALWLAD